EEVQLEISAEPHSWGDEPLAAHSAHSSVDRGDAAEREFLDEAVDRVSSPTESPDGLVVIASSDEEAAPAEFDPRAVEEQFGSAPAGNQVVDDYSDDLVGSDLL